jgi:hypothetical protein
MAGCGIVHVSTQQLRGNRPTATPAASRACFCAKCSCQQTPGEHWEERRSDHKFKVGQLVYVRIPGGAGGVHEIKQLIPSVGDEPQYRVKSQNEPQERVVKESEISGVA